MTARNDTLDLIGRIFLALLFLGSGVSKIMDYQSVGQSMAGAGVPMVAAALPLAIAVEIAAALGLIFGLLTCLSALALIVYTVAATYFFHNFWAFEGQEAQMHTIQFSKNLALVGGLLLVVAAGAGRFSVDGRHR
ncbi:MAG: DoxX family protein [Reyranellaceae bacterium]